MTTSIIISGQVMGNRVLRTAIEDFNCESFNTPFNGTELVFKTKKEAKKALWEAFKKLRADKEDAAAARLSYNKFGSLRYDASKAEIVSK